MFLRFLICGLFVISIGAAQSLANRYSHLGKILLFSSSSAPFPHPDRASGYAYGKKIFPSERHYQDSSVALFIPKNFSPGNSIDLVIYFHGWYNTIDSACVQFSLIEQFSESNKNAVFVFPEGPKDAPDSFGGRLEANGGLKNLVDDVLKILRESKITNAAVAGRIILAGHSGAFRVMAFCLLRGGLTENISDVFLFDALYGHTEKYAHWIEHSNGRFINIYTNDGGTKSESENLMTDLKEWGIPYSQSEETSCSTDDLRKQQVLFLHSDLSHNGVIAQRRQFRDYLITSKLQPIYYVH